MQCREWRSLQLCGKRLPSAGRLRNSGWHLEGWGCETQLILTGYRIACKGAVGQHAQLSCSRPAAPGFSARRPQTGGAVTSSCIYVLPTCLRAVTCVTHAPCTCWIRFGGHGRALYGMDVSSLRYPSCVGCAAVIGVLSRFGTLRIGTITKMKRFRNRSELNGVVSLLRIRRR